MRLIAIRFKQGYIPTPEELCVLKEAWVFGSAIEPDKDGCMRWWDESLVDADKMPLCPFEITRVVRNDAPLGLDTNTAARVPVVNNKVNVMVPGLGLLLLDDVKVCTDYCTDSLREELNSGWRIVAVCPQPDQRRPDYVLGRVRPIGDA